jgi:acetyl esterase/lipase
MASCGRLALVSIPAGSATPHADATVVADLPFAAPGGHPLLADLHLPVPLEAPVPAILWIHGGGWRSGNRRVGPDLSRFFAARGFAMVAIDYRLSGRATFPAQIEDVKTAIRWVRSIAADYHLDSSRIGVWGASSGGHLAALAGLTGDALFTPADAPYRDRSGAVQAVVAGYGPIDFLQLDAHRPPPGTRSDDPENLALPRPGMRSVDADSYESLLLGAPIATCPERVREASPLTYVHAGAPPFLIVHGASDTTVAPRQSELLFEALRREGNDATLVLVEGLGHGFFNRSDLDERGDRRMAIFRSSSAGITRESADAPVFGTIATFFRRALVPA